MRRRPWVLASVTWAYVVWSAVPILVAIQFSFNDGRSRSTWQGFSLQWYFGSSGSVAEDPSLRLALVNSLTVAGLTTLIATPLGVATALGLARWRGRTGRAVGGLTLMPLATPEIVLSSALYLVFTNLYLFVPLGQPAQILGHVTFSVSYVVVIVRSRLASIGTDYEEAARDLGCGRLNAVRLILLPLLTPAVFAGAMIVFASSMDDFVISAFLSPDASSVTVPIKLYSAVRNAPTPALNALAALLMLTSLAALLLGWLMQRRMPRQDGIPAHLRGR
ncbi:ABC transporter permease [Herbidospora yilanensis]|uniref:ABC transporter permease n=1 Tax=Herbidospora yilanensis TaxID=354426 RepID=UPI000781F88E|nr:ABC transporter permease [Herbidospora yilanensis]